MRKLLSVLVLVAWGLWLGGTVALILFVMRLFAVSRPVALEAAPVLFRTFAQYQMIVGFVACAAGTLLALVTWRKAHAVMTLLLLGALASAILIRVWTYEMEEIRLAGNSGGPEFRALHGKSSAAYTTAAGLLLVAGIGFILTLPTRRTASESALA